MESLIVFILPFIRDSSLFFIHSELRQTFFSTVSCRSFLYAKVRSCKKREACAPSKVCFAFFNCRYFVTLHTIVLCKTAKVRLKFSSTSATTILSEVSHWSRVIAHDCTIILTHLTILETVWIWLRHHLSCTTCKASRSWLFVVFIWGTKKGRIHAILSCNSISSFVVEHEKPSIINFWTLDIRFFWPSWFFIYLLFITGSITIWVIVWITTVA